MVREGWERDLYLNIAGRAGRAGIAAEGTVVVLDSDSRFLRGHVTRSLWREEENIPVSGQLLRVTSDPQSLAGQAELRDVQSQLLAWLGEAGKDSDTQAVDLASESFTWHGSSPTSRDRVVNLFEELLEDLEDAGLVRAGSPYSLTRIGERARLAGLGPRSCVRLHRSVSERYAAFPGRVVAQTLTKEIIRERLASQIAALLFETEETLEQSLWFRRLKLEEAAKTRYLRDLDT